MIRLILRCMDTMQSCSKAQVIFSIDWVSLLRAQHLHKMYIHSILTWPIFYIWIDPYIQKDVCVFVYYNVLFREKWDITGKKKKSMLSSVWASTMISLVIELSTRLINKQLSPPVYFLSSLDHCYLCFNNNSKKKKTVWSFSLYKQTRLNRSVWMIFGFSGNAALMQLHKIDLFQLHREKNRLLLRAEQSTSGSSPVNIHN